MHDPVFPSRRPSRKQIPKIARFHATVLGPALPSYLPGFSDNRCPAGDHYHTDGVTDIQRVNCTGGSGVFTLIFRDESTAELSYDINAANMEAALEATPW